MQISAVIPAYKEENRIGRVINETKNFVEQTLVVDDGSTDGTVMESEEAGAKVIKNSFDSGYIGAIKTGFREASGDIIVTMDADGEHDPADIPKLTEPIRNDNAEVVLGKRNSIARPSERFLCFLARFRLPIEDCGTGFRALRGELAKKMALNGYCTCGTFVLEAFSLGARIEEIPINLRSVDKPRGVAWKHLAQTWYVLKWLAIALRTDKGES